MIKNSGNFKGAGLKALEARIRALGKKKVVVGVPASANHARKDGLSNATIAAAHEFGVPGHIPERSFLRSTLNENKEKAADFLSRKLKEALTTDGNVTMPLIMVGQNLVGEIGKKIEAGISPPLSEATKAARRRKNKSAKAKEGRKMTPLHDTGNLLAAITYEVRDDG
ncbi:hypothetical protein B5C26_21140 [Photorhabdus luminescens]|uniref:Phage protein n=1 Tax=Photorhabdus luminescens subsp. mexicana TaxID=2100167 RepID=A0A4R4IR69_PHOLU|nr:hypothetical protein [Photorhabdus luminescens]OWO79286.1 hypothetical protein B5C26_21140 [Photorhabdus luminescens]TDB43203.1 hypothetical protein C5468_24180 [Photorhabdus luminescens subsp. mexicana]